MKETLTRTEKYKALAEKLRNEKEKYRHTYECHKTAQGMKGASTEEIAKVRVEGIMNCPTIQESDFIEKALKVNENVSFENVMLALGIVKGNRK